MSNDTFQIVCPSCGSKLNAKAHLIGQSRNCPKCKTPILIRREPGTEKSVVSDRATPIILSEPSISVFETGPTLEDGTGRIEHLPERLDFRNRYLILGADRLVAVWEMGKGWQVNIGNGFASAKKNVSAIPDQGTFVLVELVISAADGGLGGSGGPTELFAFKVSSRGALTALYRDEGEILGRVDSVGELTKLQKSILLNYLRQNFMAEALAGSQGILDGLSMTAE